MNNEVIKILLIDDDEDDYIVTRDMLSEAKTLKCKLQWVSTYDKAIKAINDHNHDVYLLDYRLGERTGLELLDEAMAIGCRAPIILLTGEGDHEVDIKAMKAGAADYLDKGEITTPLLERSIRYSIERKRTEENIFRMAYYDSLTSLPNRTLFQDRLKQAIAHNSRQKKLLAVLFLDVDNFKRINDTFGHCMGDNLLKGIADRLNSIMRDSDSVARQNVSDLFARLGGDEFTVLLNEIKEVEDAAKVAQRIIDTLSRPFILDGNEIFITTSIGISIYPHDGEDLDDLLKNADAAMYHAKEQGKNNYQYYRQSMNAAAFEKLTLENTLRRAIDREELVLHYQPQIDIKTGKITGVEALLRWHHPDRGLVLPLEFIPLAEETGLIIPLSEWVLSTAAIQCRAWRDAGFNDIPISVNISCRHFQQRKMIKTIAENIEKSNLRPGDLILEISESTIMQDTDTVFVTLTELAKMGLRLTIDDFGKGYSSLNYLMSYLKRFPIHALKIDRTFVKEISANPDDAIIARAIISLAKNLKIRAIAEGVETEQQLSFLREHGCDEIQGYLFCRPLPAEEIATILNSDKNGPGIGFKLCTTSQKM